MRLSRTNPAFSQLAHQRAIVSYVISILQERYLGTEAGDPPDVMYSEDLPRDESVIPEAAILLFIKDLQINRLEVEKQMGQYDFIPKGTALPPVPNLLASILHPLKQPNDQAIPQPKDQKGNRSKHKKGT